MQIFVYRQKTKKYTKMLSGINSRRQNNIFYINI